MSETIQWQTAAGGSAVNLAVAADAISAFRVNGQPLTQAVGGIRAATMQHIGRGNLSTRVSFLVTRAAAASPVAAKTAIATETAALQATYTTHALLEGVMGALTWQLLDAALESFELWQNGATVYAQFSFIGGEFSAA